MHPQEDLSWSSSTLDSEQVRPVPSSSTLMALISLSSMMAEYLPTGAGATQQVSNVKSDFQTTWVSVSIAHTQGQTSCWHPGTRHKRCGNTADQQHGGLVVNHIVETMRTAWSGLCQRPLQNRA